MYQTFLGAMAILMMIEMNISLTTDWWWGAKDPFGPYPRIPNKDLVKREIAFAEECRKFMTAPKDEWY
ncbi:PREDICTED: uncharacterized protein LOC108746841 [Trachymyrmex septentrionalis]|uniref:uncharacterized protein LOC108746841 n=1 Tax=Trachymyrmex septentrionalis TaxID=34720 RepID=UPI00084F807A|nr:PREDICTED: uncharacterized protein LOC108746841 [Trachymyrmex septentrionalis]